MAAGIVYHNVTTAAGVTFALACWVPDTSAPNTGAIPVSVPMKSDGTLADMTLVQSYTSRLLSGATPTAHATATATTGFNVGGVYNATPPTFLDTEQGSIQLDANGRIKTAASLAEETSKVIGTANLATAVGGALTATSNALDINVKSGVNANGQATMANSAPVVLASDTPTLKGYYVAVAASQTDSVIQSSTGATGDYLKGVLVVPATTAPGVVTIKDNATALVSYPGGGTTALLTLTPFFIPVDAFSRSGAWKITTGANVSVLAIGKFS